VDIDALADRARQLGGQGRALLGIAGAPGAGKSTLAEQLVARVGSEAVVVPMDGFHLHDDELARLGLADRKGAPETFDVHGYVALLGRLRTETTHTVWAPAFDRTRELAVAGAIGVRPEHRVVVTEGNYLLLERDGWSAARPLLDEVWFVEQEETTRVERLVERHVEHGKPADLARRWTLESDQANADLVHGTRAAADLVVAVG
jgi:pantothenate kinase